jgi:hypothetical protein
MTAQGTHTEPSGVQWCCTDCLILEANGEAPIGHMTEDEITEWEERRARNIGTAQITLGMMAEEHSCQDENGERADECECEIQSFSWSACDMCGGNLGGERHAFTFWFEGPEFTEYLDTFTQHYCIAMLWANTREYGGDNCKCPGDCEGHEVSPGDYQTPRRDDWALQAFASGSHAPIEGDCHDFVQANWDALQKAQDEFGRGPDSSGHDFALTRNHHGAGFWDRGMGDLGDTLTDAAHPYGESTASITDGGEPELDSA